MNVEEARKQRDVDTIRLDRDIDFEFQDEQTEARGLKVNMGISSILGTRKNQQDTVFGQMEAKKGIAIVCDGMGGLNGGEIASQTAVKILAEDYFSEEAIGNIPLFFKNEAVKMDRAVNSLKDEKEQPLKGGTTVVAVIVEDGKLYWLSVGDSKIYIIRDEEILPVNREHNYRLRLDEELKRGMITEEEYKAEEKQAEALISYIGMGKVSLMDINATPFELLEDDIVLLCSDGLYKRLEDEEIKEIIRWEEPDMIRAAKRLTEVAMKKATGAQDNTSVILLQYSRY